MAAAAVDDEVAGLAGLIAGMTPARFELWYRSLHRHDQRLVDHAMAVHFAAGWRRDPAAFAAHLDPGGFTVYGYVQLLADLFVEAIDGTRPRQLWALPGRYGKTTLLRYGVSWALDRRPASRSIYTSYANELAHESGVAVRDILNDHADQLRVRLRYDRAKGDRWYTPEGGGLLAKGIKSGITGFGVSAGGALIIDDPLKGWQEAHRKTDRDDAMGRIKGTLRNRLDDERAGIIVVHHRLHRDDPIGRLHDEAEQGTGEAWHLTAIPALAPDPEVARAAGRTPRPDPLGRAPGEPIEPARFDLAAVRSRHLGMGSSYLVSALEQQDPQPAEGLELLREWFVLVDEAEMPRAAETAITSWDTKLKDNEQGDWVVGQCWWRVAGAYFLVDQLRGQYDHATTACAIALMAVRHPEARAHWIEAAASAPEVIRELRKAQDGYHVTDTMAERLAMSPDERDGVQQLRRAGMPLLRSNPVKGDKSVRARAYIAPHAEPGHVRLPANAPWLPGLLDELTGFPTWDTKDQVDAMSQALQKLARGGATAAAAKGQVAGPAAGAHRQGPQPAGRTVAVQAPRGRLPRPRR